jgi:hypothetical protein
LIDGQKLPMEFRLLLGIHTHTHTELLSLLIISTNVSSLFFVSFMSRVAMMASKRILLRIECKLILEQSNFEQN